MRDHLIVVGLSRHIILRFRRKAEIVNRRMHQSHGSISKRPSLGCWMSTAFQKRKSSFLFLVGTTNQRTWGLRSVILSYGRRWFDLLEINFYTEESESTVQSIEVEKLLTKLEVFNNQKKKGNMTIIQENCFHK